MSTVARPQGPLPARVYWVRRLVVLTLVLLVGWLMLRWTDGGGSGAAQPDDEAAPAATEPSDQSEPDSRESSRDRDRSPRIRTVAESFERPEQACDLTEVLVEPSVSDPVYAGEPVRMTLRISTTSSTACSLSVDVEHLLVSISAGRDLVWDSTRCDDAIPARELALQPRWSALVDLTWSGRYSGRNCAPDASEAEPGSYTVEAAVLEGEPTEAEFELVERPEPPEDPETETDGADETETDGADETETDGADETETETDDGSETSGADDGSDKPADRGDDR